MRQKENAPDFFQHLTQIIDSIQAGIASLDNPDRLLIALEPEAASIFCRKLRIRDCVIEDDLKAKAGDDSLISEDFDGQLDTITYYATFGFSQYSSFLDYDKISTQISCIIFKYLKRGELS